MGEPEPGQEIRGLVIGNKLSQHARGFRLSHDSWLSREGRAFGA